MRRAPNERIQRWHFRTRLEDGPGTGPGNAMLSGSSAELHAETSGAGAIEAGNLNVGKATVKSRGPGSITLASISDTLDAALSGAGTCVRAWRASDCC
jgi:hypothetical protein